MGMVPAASALATTSSSSKSESSSSSEFASSAAAGASSSLAMLSGSSFSLSSWVASSSSLRGVVEFSVGSSSSQANLIAGFLGLCNYGIYLRLLGRAGHGEYVCMLKLLLGGRRERNPVVKSFLDLWRARVLLLPPGER